MTTTQKPRRMARPPLVDADGVNGSRVSGIVATEPVATMPAEKRATKQSLVLGLLHRDGGASLAELIKATGWLPHTARAALTGLRKKGHAIERASIDGTTRYKIAPAASE